MAKPVRRYAVFNVGPMEDQELSLPICQPLPGIIEFQMIDSLPPRRAHVPGRIWVDASVTTHRYVLRGVVGEKSHFELSTEPNKLEPSWVNCIGRPQESDPTDPEAPDSPGDRKVE